jgi:hypothetical protein
MLRVIEKNTVIAGMTIGTMAEAMTTRTEVGVMIMGTEVTVITVKLSHFFFAFALSVSKGARVHGSTGSPRTKHSPSFPT